MRLIDCFTNLMAYSGHTMARADSIQLSYDQFDKDVGILLDEAEVRRHKGGFTDREFEEARFAVCAWVDEQVLTSKWPERERWEHNQLQRRFYNTTNAGEEFYERLAGFGDEDRPVLEVYSACLVMGFTGRYYAIRDRLNLEDKTREVIEALMSSEDDPFSAEDAKFFPCAYIGEKEKAKPRGRWGTFWFMVILVIVAVGVVAGVYFGSEFHLNHLYDLYFQGSGVK